MIDPVTGLEHIEDKSFDDDAKSQFLTDLKKDQDFLFELRSILNVGGMRGAGGGLSSLDAFTTDNLTEGSTNLYSPWETYTETD